MQKKKKTITNAEVESALLMWFNQKRVQGQPVSGVMLQEKAVIFNTMLEGSPNFQASNGWLHRFKQRNGLRKLSLKGEKLSSDMSSADEFTEMFKAKMIAEKLDADNIYNADESGIYYRLLLNYTLAARTETSVSGMKDKKDRFTALFCSNATGTCRIPLLIIGKSAKPHCLRNCLPRKTEKLQVNYIQSLAVSYSSQSSAWMNVEIFMQWYQKEFIPRVLEHKEKTGNKGKVILLLDNAPSYPSREKLNTIHPDFEVMYLPPNVTALIQPMDQSPISSTDRKSVV